MEPVTGTILLKGLERAKTVAAQPLDGAGNALGKPIFAKGTEEGWTVAIGAPVTPWYVIRVER